MSPLFKKLQIRLKCPRRDIFSPVLRPPLSRSNTIIQRCTPKSSSAPFHISVHPQTDIQTCPVVGGVYIKEISPRQAWYLASTMVAWAPIHPGTCGSILFPVLGYSSRLGGPALQVSSKRADTWSHLFTSDSQCLKQVLGVVTQ